MATQAQGVARNELSGGLSQLAPHQGLSASIRTNNQDQQKSPLHGVQRAVFGRRDWIRTNDPYHVKVVL